MKCPKCQSKLNILRCNDVSNVPKLIHEPGTMIPIQVEVRTTKIYTCSNCYTKITTFEETLYNKEIRYNRAEEEV